MDNILESAVLMLQKRPPKLLKQLLYCLDYLSEDDQEVVKKAYVFSSISHEHQSRQSGEPYIHHPAAVATTLAELKLDKETISAGLLHDVLEDTTLTKELLHEEFGSEILSLVDGVSKLDQIEYADNNQRQAESFRKMMLAMVQDIRVILIKLADRLHNIQTLNALDTKKQMRIGKETLEVYAPIANRLGIFNMKVLLEKEAFKFAYPYRYKIISRALKKKLGNQKRILKKISTRISKKLNEKTILHDIEAREKDLFSVYKKMKKRHLSLDQIVDMYGLRIIVDDVHDCYQVLGLVHEVYKPIMGKFKDYIAIPRVNGYQSIHTSLLGPGGTPIEVQIRTRAMHRVAENGIAAHWKYKSENPSDASPQAKAREWLASIQEIQGVSHPEEFLESVKVDLFPDKVYVFSPKGKIFRLPSKATCVDFAYAVHSDLGNSCIGAKINKVQMPLRTVIESGQTIEILTSKNSNPDPNWLSFITTAKARNNLRNYLKKLTSAQTSALGKRLFNNALNTLGKKQRNISKKQIQLLLESLAFKNMDELYENIGLGDKNPLLIAQMMLGEQQENHTSFDHAPLLIKGTEGVSITFSNCCHPIPGDAIIGHLSKAKGLVIHRRKCLHVNSFIKEISRWISVEWVDNVDHMLSTEITVHAKHQPGSFAEIAGKIADNGCNVEQVSIATEYEDDTVDLLFQIQVENRKYLADIIKQIRVLQSVKKVTRSMH
ncbi:MAG: bifunctional (p)ppGpp synthetase/guanosine-3',5'-bis(diphosphate) 3'-pyrophosphohydrolase [Gammaproteobacteria bacterium]|nr:bifunctional (p)ppGpp synthetase/guanosine-3',5'-bis(diphosphate) 3'-pyrophosphohydrolase [Gammaproteobacteria bacterium]